MLGFIPDGCSHRAWTDNNDIDPIEHQFAAETFRESFQPVLGCRIRSQEWTSIPAADRADVYDATGVPAQRTIRAEERDECLRDDQQADEIYLKLFPKFIRR